MGLSFHKENKRAFVYNCLFQVKILVQMFQKKCLHLEILRLLMCTILHVASNLSRLPFFLCFHSGIKPQFVNVFWHCKFFYFAFVQKLIGSPDDASLGFLRSDNARRYVRQLPQCRKQQFSARFPNMSAVAVDLLEKMLVFDPNKRITGTSQETEFQARISDGSLLFSLSILDD